jgi:hypothetical protein
VRQSTIERIFGLIVVFEKGNKRKEKDIGKI